MLHIWRIINNKNTKCIFPVNFFPSFSKYTFVASYKIYIRSIFLINACFPNIRTGFFHYLLSHDRQHLVDKIEQSTQLVVRQNYLQVIPSRAIHNRAKQFANQHRQQNDTCSATNLRHRYSSSLINENWRFTLLTKEVIWGDVNNLHLVLSTKKQDDCLAHHHVQSICIRLESIRYYYNVLFP